MASNRWSTTVNRWSTVKASGQFFVGHPKSSRQALRTPRARLKTQGKRTTYVERVGDFNSRRVTVLQNLPGQ
jgi:hypothetical protein